MFNLYFQGYHVLEGIRCRREFVTDMYTQINELLIFTQTFDISSESSVDLPSIQRELKKWTTTTDEHINLSKSTNVVSIQ